MTMKLGRKMWYWSVRNSGASGDTLFISKVYDRNRTLTFSVTHYFECVSSLLYLQNICINLHHLLLLLSNRHFSAHEKGPG